MRRGSYFFNLTLKRTLTMVGVLFLWCTIQKKHKIMCFLSLAQVSSGTGLTHLNTRQKLPILSCIFYRLTCDPFLCKQIKFFTIFDMPSISNCKKQNFSVKRLQRGSQNMQEIIIQSKSQIDHAGKKVILENIPSVEKNNYLNVIDKWRILHAYPMAEVARNINILINNKDNKIVVQRLKRLETILNKLERFPQMRLSMMQDLGGCRVILPSVEDVYQLSKLLKSKMPYKLHGEKDYIQVPNLQTGYRGIHLIFEFRDEINPQYNGLLIEVQLRTRTQHLWATAVETVGTFTQNELKFNQGDAVWLTFFRLVSVLFASEEKPNGYNYNKNPKPYDYIEGLLELIEKYKLLGKLHTFIAAKTTLDQNRSLKETGYYLLQLNIKKPHLNIEYFENNEISQKKAIDTYLKLEKHKKKHRDVVLVTAESISAVKDAYQNYFGDLNEFINEFTSTLFSCMRNQLDRIKSIMLS